MTFASSYKVERTPMAAKPDPDPQQPEAETFDSDAPPPKESVLRKLFRNSNAIVGMTILGLVILGAIFAPLISAADPLIIQGDPFIWPGQSAEFLLGTDALGRDVLSGVLNGARVSLFVGLAATMLSLTLGITIGALAGYFGGWVDDLIVRFIEIFQTIPHFVLLVVIVAVATPSVYSVVFGIALVSWDVIARLTRAEFRSLREKEFVMAARSAGYSNSRIIYREILPNALPSLTVTASIMVATAILLESALSFLGLSDPNVVTWGSMIGAARESMRTYWYLTAIPGVFIVITVLALNLIGDGLNDAMNPKSKVNNLAGAR